LKYTYVFHSPIKYWITSDDGLVDDIVSPDKVNIKNLNTIVNNMLTLKTKNFISLVNNPGIVHINFKSFDNGSFLETIVESDHKLIIGEFNRIYKDLQYQLADGIGKTISSEPITSFKDSVEFTNDHNLKELRSVIKKVYCLLHDGDNWELKFMIK